VQPADWSRREQRALLNSSEERLRNIEGKGPGLATVSAVIIGALLLAITGGWHQSELPARAILVLAVVYGILSLGMPLYLVGPMRRHTVHVAEIEAAAVTDDPEQALANQAAAAAMQNDLQNLRLGNLLDAARRELAYALVLLILWGLLVPATGALRRGPPSVVQPPAPAGHIRLRGLPPRHNPATRAARTRAR
jgi:hypothetical protein